MRPGGEGPQDGRQPKDDWIKRLDTNADGKLDAAELQAAIDASFKAWDKMPAARSKQAKCRVRRVKWSGQPPARSAHGTGIETRELSRGTRQSSSETATGGTTWR